MFILQVIPITKSIRVPSLSYFSAKDVALGSLVTVPLRKQEIVAIVVAKEAVLDFKSMVRSANFQLRNILKVHEEHIFTSAFLNMSQQIAQYSASHTGVIMDTLLSKSIIRDIKAFAKIKTKKENRNKHQIFLLQRSSEELLTYYKTRAREVLASGSSLFITCPTVQQAQNIYASVSKGIEKKCFLFHGSLSAKKIRDAYAEMSKKSGPVVIVGTPGSVALAPEDTLEFIIDSCSSLHYRTISQPQIDTRLCIEKLAFHSKAHCVYSDNMVPVSVWNRVRGYEIEVLEPASKKVLDPKKLSVISYKVGKALQSEKNRLEELQHSSRGFHPLHVESMKHIKTSLKRKEKIFLFVPKKGIAPNMVCGDCGKIAVSPETSLPYSLYTQINKETGKKENIYVCNANAQKIAAFDQCQFCDGVNLKKMGIGTSSLAETLQESFPKTTILVVDGQHTKTKKQIAEIKKEYHKKKSVIVIGTSKVLSVLDSWDTAFIVTLAPLFSQMSYTNEESIVALLSNIQQKTTGTVYLQDRKDSIKTLPILKDGMYQSFVDSELKIRKSLNYPPYQTLIHVKATVLKRNLKQHYGYLLKGFGNYDPSIMLQPNSKTHAAIILIMKLSLDMWSLDYQDSKLKNKLQNQERNVRVTINPEKLN